MEKTVLDGLAWAGISEPARIARISAKLVRGMNTHSTKLLTRADVKMAVRDTLPPYGRGKIITEAVELEYRRQKPIYDKRQKRHNAFQDYQEEMGRRASRLNHAYAAAFDRPLYEPCRSCPIPYTPDNRDERDEWDRAERDRDKGEECLGITHQDGHIVALMSNEKAITQWHIATRLKRGPVVKTYLRCNLPSQNGRRPRNLVAAAMSLGGPKARTALAKGKQVETDWVGRRTLIYHDSRDYHHSHIEVVDWRAVAFERVESVYARPPLRPYPVLIQGDTLVRDVQAESKQGYGPIFWNDID